MGTRCLIGIETESKPIKSIFCQFDGGLEHMRAMLSYWNTTIKVKKLIKLGFISSLRESSFETLIFRSIPDDPKSTHRAEKARNRFAFLLLGKKHNAVYNYLWSTEKETWLYCKPEGKRFIQI